MITYDLTSGSEPLYKNLYDHIKADVLSGKLVSGEKLPSKRNLAKNLGISVITIENAFAMLMDEGYITGIPKKGYFVADISNIGKFNKPPQILPEVKAVREVSEPVKYDFSSNRTESSAFPFSIWKKLMREVLAKKEKELMDVSPPEGIGELRSAIANHLSSFRGMVINPDQIIVGAGTEYLYGLLIKLLGADNNYCIENPGYTKLYKIYKSYGIEAVPINLDDSGIIVDELRQKNIQIAHVTPTHHFPTGITMSVKRRYELLSWAGEDRGRYIIEDDYDSEFRLKGKPIPSLQSIDSIGRVIYMNTFSKSLSSTVRISYMVLPEELANKFYRELYFYSNTVSTFEQYTLAEFISRGYFEKHINRMRLHYGRKRQAVLDLIREFYSEEDVKIIENDSGLHFIVEIKSDLSDDEIKKILKDKGIKLSAITDYYMGEKPKNLNRFIVNYSNSNIDDLRQALMLIGNYK